MLKKYKNWKRNQKVKKGKPGDGHGLKRFGLWHSFTKTLFHIHLADDDGRTRKYSVLVDYYMTEDSIKLYIDGKHAASSEAPAIFRVPGGFIEVGTSTYGITRMHYVSEGHEDVVLSPHKSSMEGLRRRFEKKFPRASRVIGWIAILILLVSIVLLIPQLLEYASMMDIVRDNIGTFTSPIQLSSGLNLTLIILTAAAAYERALTLKNHWLIDIETNTFDE